VNQSAASTPDCVDRHADSDMEIVTYARTLIFENTVFTVFADHIADKSGCEVTRYLSVVPKCLSESTVAGVAVLPVSDGKVGLIRVFRHPLGRWSWEAIKGHVEPGENVSSAALRELQEEAGFLVTAEDLIDYGAVTPEAGVIKARTCLFVVKVNDKAVCPITGELGHGDIVFYTSEEINNLIAQGEIEDASTLVILLKYQLNQSGFE
jgi:ADP-ribose pyrophosphatase